MLLLKICVDFDDSNFISYGNFFKDSSNGQENSQYNVVISFIINRMLVKMLKKTSNEYAMKIMQCSSVSMLQNFWSKPGVKTKLTQC